MKKFDITINTRFDNYHVEDADRVMQRDGTIVIIKENKTLYFNLDKIEYYSIEEKEKERE